MRYFIDTRAALREFLILGVIGTIASVVGIAGGLNSLFGGSSGSTTGGYNSGTGAASSTGALNTISPSVLAAFQQLMGLDTSGVTNTANQAGGNYASNAGFANQYRDMLQRQAGVQQGAQNTLMQSGDAAFAAGQDPQQALYQRLLQQTQDGSRAATSARGIGTSPEAAGIENRAVGDFNLGWQNQQLARMLQGLGGQTSAYNAAGNQGQLLGADLSGAMNFANQVPTNILQSGQVPYQGQQQAAGQPIQAANQYSTALNTAFNPGLANYNLAGAQFGANQSAAGTNAALTGLSGLNTAYNQPGSWLSTAFGGGTNPNYGDLGGGPW